MNTQRWILTILTLTLMVFHSPRFVAGQDMATANTDGRRSANDIGYYPGANG